jgi:uncharacterized damage-inducible protein DinB
MPKPDLSTVPEWYHKYIHQIDEADLNKAIEENTEKALQFLRSISEDKWNYRYAEGKWSIKEMIQHIIDAERIFSFRALCFARQDKTPLPGFEENDYAAASKADNRTRQELLSEFETVRHSVEQLYASFDEEQLAATGIANNNSISVNAIGFIIPGHMQHHLTILQERYL